MKTHLNKIQENIQEKYEIKAKANNELERGNLHQAIKLHKKRKYSTVS